MLATYDVTGQLRLLPIEEDSFYALFLRELLVSPRRFDAAALNLAAWIQEVALEHFNRYTLEHGRSAHLPPLFRWHYAFLPVIAKIVEAASGDLPATEVTELLKRARDQADLDSRRQEAERLLRGAP